MEEFTMSKPIRVLIADDHRLMLDGLAQALNSIPDIEVVGTVVDGTMLEDAVKRYSPTVLLVDVEMPGRSGLSANPRSPTSHRPSS
jgi:DNA-binding NarL/FixJ family response regulator